LLKEGFAMSHYAFKTYSPDILEKIISHQHIIWGSSVRKSAAYFEWKYLKNPFYEQPLVYAALYDDRVVAIRGMFGTCWERAGGDQEIVLPSAADAGVHPAHRESGLFNELSDYAMEDLRNRGIDYVLNLSPTPSNYVVSLMTMGWNAMGFWEEMQLGGEAGAASPAGLTRLSGHARKTFGVYRRRVKKVFGIDGFRLLDKNSASFPSPMKVSNEPRPEAMAQFIEQCGDNHCLRHIRNTAYLAWRFNNPRFCYRFIFWGDKEIEGYLVLQNMVGCRQVKLVDWEGRTDEVRSKLLASAIKLGGFRNMTASSRSLDPASIGQLKDSGFVEYSRKASGYSNGLLYKRIQGDAENCAILGLDPGSNDSWDLRMIYSDGA
jgi:GNAT superfamily N-acetyltransferase